MERHIVHCDLDSFFVSVERLLHGALKGKPVLIGGLSDRAVVASCSYEARAFGVHSAMPMKLALRLCPEAVVLRGDFEVYSKYSNLVTDIIASEAPVVEKASIDEHYIDISGMDKFFGCWQWSLALRQKIIKETGLPISFGLSSNKTVSKIATGEAKPSGERQVLSGTEKAFLAPLSIRKIPMIGEQSYTILRNMGIVQCHTLQQMDALTMRSVLGENGVLVWKKANGVDDTPVVPYREQKSRSKETTFQQDTIDMQLLRKTLARMVDELAFELRKERQLCGVITLKIRYSNFDTHTKQLKIAYTHSARLLTEKVLELFTKLYSRRMLIRLVGIRLSHLIHGSLQADLFNHSERDMQLALAMDSIRKQYGFKAVMRADTW